MGDPNKEMYDSIMHSKSKGAGSDSVAEKYQFPLTRYSDILGAPHLANLETVKDAFPDEYLLLQVGELNLSEQEFTACFGNIVTV